MQISMFDGSNPLKITKPIRLIENFAGIGAQAKALERLGVDFEHYRVVEFDKYAIKSYNTIHGTNFPTMDITQTKGADLGIVDTDKYDYIMTYSFPCTDLSSAGKMQGMSRNSGTRSGLLWEVERLLKEVDELPQFLLMENVPEVMGKKTIKDFAEWIAFLDSLGYTSKWCVMNAKDYGVPQNRDRCFMLSWLYKDCYYDFPQQYKLKIRLKHLLEENVDEKYYLSDRVVKYFTEHSEDMKAKGNGFRFQPFDKEAEPVLIQVGQIEGSFESTGRVYSIEGISPTINTCGGGDREPNILVKSATKRGYEEADIGDSIDLEMPNSATRRGRVGKQVSQTLLTSCNIGVVETDRRIRKLTPLETWRLMDFDDADFYAAKNVGISDSQAYKQAGNSIVVNCLVEIFKKLL